MASTQVNPTRMELTRLKKKLATATRGHKLLKDKRDELMRQFLDLVRENMALRQKVEAGIRSANVNFVIAKAGMSEQALNTALAAPKQAVYLEADKKNVMSVDIPVFHYKTRTADENDIYVYFERSGRGSQVAGGHSAGYAAAVRDRESLPAHGSRDRENAPESQCAGTRNYSGGAQKYQIYHDEAG